MKKPNILVGVVALCLLFVSCMPAMRGANTFEPFTFNDFVDTDGPNIYAAQTWFVELEIPGSILTEAERDALFTELGYEQISTGVKRNGTGNWFNLSNVRAPQNWKVSLRSQVVTREILDVQVLNNSKRWRERDTLRLMLEVEVPPNAEKGKNNILALIAKRNAEGNSFPLRLTFNVVDKPQK